MGWRFRQSFKIIPGLRLNLSRSGLSVSIGGAPFTLNVGPHGLTGTASVPGTGISYRQHFTSGPCAHDLPVLPSDPNPPGLVRPGLTPPSPATPASYFPAPTSMPMTSSAPTTEVRSASTELFTS